MNKLIYTLILIVVLFFQNGFTGNPSSSSSSNTSINSSISSTISSSSSSSSSPSSSLSSSSSVIKTNYLDFYFLDVTDPKKIILSDEINYELNNDVAKIVDDTLFPNKDGTAILTISYKNEEKDIKITIDNKQIQSTTQNGLKINYNFINKNYKIGPSMNPNTIVIHNTANSASAKNEVAYLHNPTNTNSTSYHFAVDDNEVYQAIPLNKSAYHAGNIDINKKSIGIEIAKSTSSNIEIKNKAINNSITLVTMLRKKYKLNISDVITHKDASGKHCPHDILDRYGIEKYYEELRKKAK